MTEQHFSFSYRLLSKNPVIIYSVVPLLPILTLMVTSENTYFDEYEDKKSQILKQQNLASEEGDEKLIE